MWRSVEGDPLSDKAGGAPTQMLPSTAPRVEPPRGGSRAMHVTVRPWKEIEATAGQGGAPRLDAKVFHRTMTVDHIMMISGEVTLLLDKGEATLRAGDMLVQRNTNHAWLNPTDQAARFWAVMVPAHAGVNDDCQYIDDTAFPTTVMARVAERSRLPRTRSMPCRSRPLWRSPVISRPWGVTRMCRSS